MDSIFATNHHPEALKNHVEIIKLMMEMLELSLMDPTLSNQLFHDYAKGACILAFQLCMF